MSAAAQAPIKLAQQGADSLAAALKIISDLTAQQVALVVGMMRERISFRAAAPVADAANRVISGFTDAGKILLDLAASENELLVNGLKEAIGVRSDVGALADLIPIGTASMVEMHKRFLDTIAKQSRAAADAFVDGDALMAGRSLTKIAREGIEAFVETQKTFLDQVSEQVSIATAGAKESKPAPKDRAKVLMEMARDGVDKFVEAQKQVVGLMIDQMEAVKGGAGAKAVRTSLSELTRKSVVNFTAAQKSLLDLALQPVPEAPKAAKAAKAAKAKQARAPRAKAKGRKKAAAEAAA